MRALPLLLLTVATAAACTPTGASETTDTTEPEVVVPEVTEPAIRLTPFCQQMIALDESLPDDPAIDRGDQVLRGVPGGAARRAARDRGRVPRRHRRPRDRHPPHGARRRGRDDTRPRPDRAHRHRAARRHRAALAVRVDHPAVGGTARRGGGLAPDDDPAARVNAYIDFACRGTANNPGPPATQPGAVVTTTEAA
ncbi:MAG: hypothetical protein R2697_16345 [Ilumatobacteraceae bacterium]